MYPSEAITFNISKESKLDGICMIINFGPEDSEIDWDVLNDTKATQSKKKVELVKIDKRYSYIERATYGAVFHQENCVDVGKEFLNLPDHTEMLQLFENHINTKQTTG